MITFKLNPLLNPAQNALHQIPLHPANEGEEHQQQTRVHHQSPNGVFDVDVLLREIQGQGNSKIKESRLQIIRYRGFLLPNEI